MTQQQLAAEIRRVRYSHEPRTLLWQVAVSADVCMAELYRLAAGTASTVTAERAAAWLARQARPAPGPMDTPVDAPKDIP